MNFQLLTPETGAPPLEAPLLPGGVNPRAALYTYRGRYYYGLTRITESEYNELYKITSQNGNNKQTTNDDAL